MRDEALIRQTVHALLAPLMPPRLGVRLLGVTLSNLSPDDAEPPAQQQLDFGLLAP